MKTEDYILAGGGLLILGGAAWALTREKEEEEAKLAKIVGAPTISKIS